MKFTQTPLLGAFIIELQKRGDGRGFFARTFCAREFKEFNLNANILQANVSFSKGKGTMRGMHFQEKPYEEAKLIRCTRGAIYDVIIDLRPKSKTYKKWFGIELTDENYKMLYVPEGFAHGFQTLKPNTEVTYLVTEFYTPEAEKGIRYNDPAFNIKWPLKVKEISEKDNNYPDFNPSLFVIASKAKQSSKSEIATVALKRPRNDRLKL